MSIRPFRDINRKKTKVINVGKVKIGGDNPISVQSMTNTLTTNIKATIKQINANRKNALLSKGPKTDLGKLNSSKNSLKHGLTAK